MKTCKVVCFCSGLSLILLGASISWLPSFLPAVRLVATGSTDGTANIAETFQGRTAGPSYFVEIRIKITYPTRVTEDQTLDIVVEATKEFFESYDSPRVASTDRIARTYDRLSWPVTLILSGAAFEIDRTNRSFVEGYRLPLTIRWTALPKRTGSHTLSLDASKIAPVGRDWHSVTRDIDINGSPFFEIGRTETESIDNKLARPFEINRRHITDVPLPVEVLTKWGVSQFHADVSAGVFALIGFVLTLPILHALWMRWFL